MLIPLFSMLVGLLLLTGGAEGLVRAATALARRFGLSPLVIGLTVVAMGTSMPELVVSIDAALRGSPAVALGNVVGSNIANIGLILGVASLIAALRVQAQVVRFDMPILAFVSLVFIALLADGRMGRFDGSLLVFGLIVYVVYSIRWARREPDAAVEKEFDEGLPPQLGLGPNLVLLVAGLAFLLGGAHLFVEGAMALALLLNVSEVVIGLTVVAVGTSLPELATSTVAAWRGEGDIAIGNAVGSCIFNLLGILGVTALVQPMGASGIGVVDGAVMVGFTFFLMPLVRTGFVLSRLEGALLLTAYGGYVAYLVV